MEDNKWIQVYDPDGVRGEINESERHLLNEGFREVTTQELEQELLNEKLAQPIEQVKAGTEGLARGFTFGISDLVIKELADQGIVDLDMVKARKETGVSKGLEFAGDIGSLLLGGGLVKGAGLVGKQVAKQTTKQVLKKASLRGAGEGAVLESADIVSETALNENPELTAENLIKRIGTSAIFGTIADGAITTGVHGISKALYNSQLGKKVAKKAMDKFGVPHDLNDAYKKVLGVTKVKQKENFNLLIKEFEGLPNIQNKLKDIETKYNSGKIIGVLDGTPKIKENLGNYDDIIGKELGDTRETLFNQLDKLALEKPELVKNITMNPTTLINNIDEVAKGYKKSLLPEVQKLADDLEKYKTNIISRMNEDNSFRNMVKSRIEFDKDIRKAWDSVALSKDVQKNVRNSLENAITKDMEEMVIILKNQGITDDIILKAPTKIKELKSDLNLVKKLDKVIGIDPKDAADKLNLLQMIRNPFNYLKYGGAGLLGGPLGALIPFGADVLGTRLPNIYINLARSGIQIPKISTKTLPKSIKNVLAQSNKLGKLPLEKVSLSDVAVVMAAMLYDNKIPENEKQAAKNILNESTDVLESISNKFTQLESKEINKQLNKINKKENKIIEDSIETLKVKSKKNPLEIKVSNYNKIIEDLKNIDSNPDNFFNNINKISQFSAIPAPQMTMAMQGKLNQITEYLVSKIPRNMLTNQKFLFKKEFPVSEAHKKEFMKAYEYALNPNLALEQIANGNIDSIALEVLQNIYPATLEKLKTKIVENADKLQDMSFQKRKALSLALNIPLEISLQYINELQSVFQTQQPNQIPNDMARKTDMSFGEETDIERIGKS